MGERQGCSAGGGGEQKEEEEAADKRKREAEGEVCLSFKTVKVFRVQREGGSWGEVTYDG